MIYILKKNNRGLYYDTKLNPYKLNLFITAVVYDKTSKDWSYLLNTRYNKVNTVNSFLNSHNGLFKRLHDLSNKMF